MTEEYQCCDCGFKWNGQIGPCPPMHESGGCCAKCGSHYCEWLTYDEKRWKYDEQTKQIVEV
jgi:hypothetical protein